METIVLGVEPRQIKKNEAGRLRKQGIVPAVIYHKGEETVAVSVNELALSKLVNSPESHIINLKFPDGKVKRSIIKDVQFDPVSDRIIHTDFQLFAAGEVIEMEVPVTTTGESCGVEKGGKLQILRHTLHLKGSPEKMPEHFTIDVTDLDLGHSIHVRELPADSFAGLEITDDPNTPVVSVLAPRKEAEPTEEEAAAAEGEASAE